MSLDLFSPIFMGTMNKQTVQTVHSYTWDPLRPLRLLNSLTDFNLIVPDPHPAKLLECVCVILLYIYVYGIYITCQRHQ